jgi:SAM-dependent methyltransferase
VTAVGYHSSRYTADKRRNALWDTLWRHKFSAMVSHGDCVLDLGAGHCGFINAAVARRRIAVDSWEGFVVHLGPNIEHHIGSVTDLEFLENGSVDFAFASNLFEHLTREDFVRTLASLRRKLSPRGTLTIVQPNYRYAFREYFDDFDHRGIYSHISLADFLTANGYEVFLVEPRFMPLSLKSCFPVHPFLVRAWLASPIKPLGKQMLVRARPVR